MPQSETAGPLPYPARPNRRRHRPLNHRFVKMVAPQLPGLRIPIPPPRRKHPLPRPGSPRPRVLPPKRPRKLHKPAPFPQVPIVQHPDPRRVPLQLPPYTPGQHRHPILGSLGPANPNLPRSRSRTLTRSVRHSSSRIPLPYNRAPTRATSPPVSAAMIACRIGVDASPPVLAPRPNPACTIPPQTGTKKRRGIPALPCGPAPDYG